MHPFDRNVFNGLDFSASLINDEEDASGDATTAQPSINVDKETATNQGPNNLQD